MGTVSVLCTMIARLAIVVLLARWSAPVASRFLAFSEQLFEPEYQSLEPPKQTMATRTPPRRPYITPLVKKRVAARQKWRCASCKSLLDETYELDHVKPLFKGGTNAESNLQAFCKRCHMLKSAVEQSTR